MIWRRYLTVYKNSGIEVLSHIQTDWRIDMADGTITAKQKEILEYIKSETDKDNQSKELSDVLSKITGFIKKKK